MKISATLSALCTLVLCTLFPGTLAAQSLTIPLHDGWEFSQVTTPEKAQWMPAHVPGTVQQDLISNGKLPDPFYGKNEAKVQWVENEDWQYRTSFVLTEEQLQHDAAQLVFEGLDTYADVYLNGALLTQTDNMFIAYRLPVKEYLHVGDNHLHICFHSPIRKTLPQWQTDGFTYPADNDHSDHKVSIYSRKAPYSYGWDWGIRLVTMGIWRPVSLVFFDQARIDDCQVQQLSVTTEAAQLQHHIAIEGVLPQPTEATVSLSYRYKEEAAHTTQTTCTLQPGQNIIALPLTIPHPHRWMPNGWGEPALYEMTVSVRIDGQEVSTSTERIGLREIKVVNEKDQWGESFYFEVNQQPMFAKGANFIPDDALLPNISRERYRQILADARDANMNMLRVWGGGIYEDDAFYEAADEMGILIWQDFMFACTTYPSDPTFLRRVKEEATYNIKRLRNHACLALWCGNNEIYEGMRYWGWTKKYDDPTIFPRMQQGYQQLFTELLPSLIDTYDEGRFYMHSSPYKANWGRPESWAFGDSHNWGTWYGQKPFETLDNEIPRFMSEYGFQAFPEMKTIRSFASPADYDLDSEVMKAHQKASTGNFLIKKTMQRYYQVPERFEDLVYMSAVLQGQGMRHGMEAHRRHRPYCMGTLYWQLNDSWPVVSWSGIDYYGNWKALHYQARRAYAPVLVHAFREEDHLNIYVLSDLLTDLPDVSLTLSVKDFQGKTLAKETVKGAVKGNTTNLLHTLSWTQTAARPRDSYLLMTLKDAKGKVRSEEIYYFNYAKDQNLPATDIHYRVKRKTRAEDAYDTYEITLSSRTLARDVFIEVPVQGARFSDNYFDLQPRRSKTVTIRCARDDQRETMPVTLHHLGNVH